MNLDVFRSLVEERLAEIKVCGADAWALKELLGVEASSSLGLAAIELQERLSSAFSSGQSAVWSQCRAMIVELIQLSVIEEEPIGLAMEILERVRDANRTESPRSDPIVGDWSAAIRDAVGAHAFRELEGRGEAPDRIPKAYTRHVNVAMAGKRLLAQGFQLQRGGGDIRFTPESEARLVTEIERRVASYGGAALAGHIFGFLSTSYDATQERYHVGRRISHFGEGEPQIPFGYLLQLCAKHPLGSKPYRRSAEDWRRLILLSSDYAAVIDVQPYSPMYFMGHDAASLFPILRELAIYDSLFCFPQIRGSDVATIARGVLSGMDFDSPLGSGWTMAEALAVMEAILSMTRDTRGPLRLDARQVAARCPSLAPERVLLTMRDLFSHSKVGANRRFQNPMHSHGPDGESDPGDDFCERPLLRLDEDRFLLLDRSMCAPAFLEALFQPMAQADRNFGRRQVGPQAERLLRDQFRRRGVTVRAGKYKSHGEKGECDMVVETERTVILVEMKKKSLSRMARAGSDVFVILDLADSVLQAQIQAGRHELRLRRGETLNLVDDDGVAYPLCLSGREVERVAVTLPDYGAFQDRIVLSSFLESHAGAVYTVAEPKYQKRFDKLKEDLAELLRVERELAEMREPDDAPFHHCWFLSLPQLLILLDEVSDAPSFEAALRTTRNTTLGSLDFYWEHAHISSWRSAV